MGLAQFDWNRKKQNICYIKSVNQVCLEWIKAAFAFIWFQVVASNLRGPLIIGRDQ